MTMWDDLRAMLEQLGIVPRAHAVAQRTAFCWANQLRAEAV